MQFFKHYGWIHWDGKNWHTVTGYELAGPGEVPTSSAPPVFEAEDYIGDEARAKAAQDAVAAMDVGQADPGPADPAPAGATPADPSPAVSGLVAADVAAEARVADEQEAGLGQQPPLRAEAVQVREPSPPPTPPAPPAAAGGGAVWDTEHKRDEDRADAQHTLDNTRWDAQHALDNSRWDAQHALDNTRWDTYLALRRSREDTATATEASLLEAVHGGYIAVAQGSLDRAVQRATYITTAAGAVATLYTGILGLRFTADHPPLPARSLIPALFIGAAVAFSTFYMAFLRDRTKKQELLPSGLGGSIAETRLLDFMEWSFGGVLARAWSLRLSVVSLALGLALLPIGFVQLSAPVTWTVGLVAAAVLVVWIASEIYLAVAGPPEFISALADKRDRRPSRLARAPLPLPAAPAGDGSDTGLQTFGLTGQPQRYSRPGLSSPPEPPPSARLPEPPPAWVLLEPGPRPSDPAPAPVPAPPQIEVVVRSDEE